MQYARGVFGLILTCALCTGGVSPAFESLAPDALTVDAAASSQALSFEDYQTQKRVTVLRALGASALVLGMVAGVVTAVLLASKGRDGGLAPVLAVGVGAFVMAVTGIAMLGRAGFLSRRLARGRSSTRWPLRL